MYQFETACGYNPPPPQQQSLGKLVHDYLPPCRSREPKMQLLKHCLPSLQAEPTTERLGRVSLFLQHQLSDTGTVGESCIWLYINSVSVCMCTRLCNPLPDTAYPTVLVHLIKSPHPCHVTWCSFSPMTWCYYQRIEVILLQNILSLFARDCNFLLLLKWFL